MTAPNPLLTTAKLKALVRHVADVAPSTVDEAYRSNRTDNEPALLAEGRAWFLASSPRHLGPAVSWAHARGADSVTLFADQGPLASDLARRAGLLTGQVSVEVLAVEVMAVATDTGLGGPDAAGFTVTVAEPAAVVEPPILSAAHREFIGLIEAAGARPVDDHGHLIAEVAGLEVARVVGGPATNGPVSNGSSDPNVRLEVGVGLADRELHGYVHGSDDVDTNLRRVVAAVLEHRRVGSAAHPLTRIGRQRWLRSILIDDPSLLGPGRHGTLAPVAPLRPSATVLNPDPVAAVSEVSNDGVVTVCQVGADLDLIPEALDYRHRHDPDARLILVVPERDRALVASRLRLMVASADDVPLVCPALPWADGGEAPSS